VCVCVCVYTIRQWFSTEVAPVASKNINITAEVVEKTLC